MFIYDDFPDKPLPHRDALVIKVKIRDVIVHWVFININSSVTIMYYDKFTQLELSQKQLD